MILECLKDVYIHFYNSSIGHRIRLPGEVEAEEPSTKANQKKHIDKTNDRTYNIIMNDKPHHRFHLRYVVYTAGVFLGLSLLYKYNTRFRLSCQKIVVSYKCGRLLQDAKSYVYESLFSDESIFKRAWQHVSDQAHSTKEKIMDTKVTLKYYVYLRTNNIQFTYHTYVKT